MLAGRGRLRGTGYLHLISFFPGPGWGWEESRAFWCCSLPASDLSDPVLYHRATVRRQSPDIGTSQSEWRRDLWWRSQCLWLDAGWWRRGEDLGENLGVGWEEAARSIEYLQFSNFSADPFQFSQYRCSHAPAHDRGGGDLFLYIF